MQTPVADKTQLGALKRAALRLGRTRPDIIYSLPEDKVAALADAPAPYPDRKARPETPSHISCDWVCSGQAQQLTGVSNLLQFKSIRADSSCWCCLPVV